MVQGLGGVISALSELSAALRSCGASGSVVEIVVPPEDEDVLRKFFDKWREPRTPEYVIGRVGNVDIVSAQA